jgi:RimJ/RimL family protein N-acetyltransferase
MPVGSILTLIPAGNNRVFIHDRRGEGIASTLRSRPRCTIHPMFTHIETPRLILRKPTREDAEAIFARYASDPEVTRLLGWPRHSSVNVTRTFLAFSDAEWSR